MATVVILRRACAASMEVRSGNFSDIIVKVALSASVLSWKNRSLEVLGAIMETLELDNEVILGTELDRGWGGGGRKRMMTL